MTTEVQSQISALQKEKSRLEVDLEQQRAISRRQKLAYDELVQKYQELENKKNSFVQPDNIGNLPSRNAGSKPGSLNQTTENFLSVARRTGPIREALSNGFNPNNTNNKQNFGLYDQGAFEKLYDEKRPMQRKFSEISDFAQINNPDTSPPIEVEEIADEFEADSEDNNEQPLRPLNNDSRMNFKEFCKRWRAASRDNEMRIDLMHYVCLIYGFF